MLRTELKTMFHDTIIEGEIFSTNNHDPSLSPSANYSMSDVRY